MMRVVLVFLACVAMSSSSGMEKRIKQSIDKYNADVACWGKENALRFHVGLAQAIEECSNFGKPGNLLRPANPWQTVAGANTLPAGLNKATVANYWANSLFGNRQKRQAEATGGLLEADEEDLKEFLDDFQDYKEDLGSKMGNLTCVMTKMNMLDSALQVNMAEYTSGFWERIDLSKTLAGMDPIWRQRMVDGFTDCYSIAQNFPQETLDKNPVSKVFGRHMIFFKCANKVEDKFCYEAQMNDWLTTLYGEDPSFNWSQYGLPSNKYELAHLTIKVMSATASAEEEFVGDFFYM